MFNDDIFCKMKKVFYLKKTANQYLMLVILFVAVCAKAQLGNNELKLLYKNHNKALFTNSQNEVFSVEKGSQFDYYAFQNNQYSVNIIKSNSKIQTIFRKNKSGYEYNIVHNYYNNLKKSELGVVSYKVEQRFSDGANNQICVRDTQIDFSKVDNAIKDMLRANIDSFFDFKKCGSVDEEGQKEFKKRFKNYLSKKINELKECEKSEGLKVVKSNMVQLYSRFNQYANQLIKLPQDFKSSNRNILFVCDQNLQENANFTNLDGRRIVNFQLKDANKDITDEYFDKVLNVIFNHELLHSNSQEKNESISECSVEVISKLCSKGSKELVDKLIKDRDVQCTLIGKYEVELESSQLLKNGKEAVKQLSYIATNAAPTNQLNGNSPPTNQVRNINTTTAANLARTAQAEVSQISAIADRISAQVAEYPDVNPTNQQPAPPLSNSTKESVNTAMSSFGKIGDQFSKFIDGVTSQSSGGVAQAAIAGGAGAAAIGMAKSALNASAADTTQGSVSILNTKGVEAQLNPFQKGSDFNQPASADQVIDPAMLAKMNAAASNAMVASEVSNGSSQKVDTTKAQIATVNSSGGVANGMAAAKQQVAAADTGAAVSQQNTTTTEQTRTIAAVGKATPINVQQTVNVGNANTTNTPQAVPSQVARLLTDTRMNTLKGDNYKIITRYYGEEQFANVLKDRKTVVVDKDNNRIVGDAVSARNCFQDTGIEIVKLKSCPRK